LAQRIATTDERVKQGPLFHADEEKDLRRFKAASFRLHHGKRLQSPPATKGVVNYRPLSRVLCTDALCKKTDFSTAGASPANEAWLVIRAGWGVKHVKSKNFLVIAHISFKKSIL
jgi:hypothetical protein